MIPSLLCFSLTAEMVFDAFILLLAIIPIKQLSGYSYWDTVWRIAVAIIPFLILLTLIFLALIVVVMIYILVNYR